MNSYFSKILLFGEYSIIKGSSGLALPLHNFSGQLDFTENRNNLNSKLSLYDFYKYLAGSSLIKKEINLEKMEHDIQQGLYFKSNIPQGYGVGSSGALCASLYAEYAYQFESKDFYEQDELSYLKDIMSLMESFYHGTSSGIDCLISLIDLPLFIQSRSEVRIIENPVPSVRGDFYLYDSGQSRNTSSLVHSFLSKYEKDSQYKRSILELTELTNNIINKILNHYDFSHDFAQLSRLQYLIMSRMIPESIRDFWLEGLESKQYYLKLCGAGGGGYFIVYTKDDTVLNNINLTHNLVRIKYGKRL